MISRLNYPHIELFIWSWFLADILVPILIALSPRLGAVDKPRTYKAHAEPVSFLGGVGIFVAFALTLASTLRLPDASRYEHVLDYFLVGGGRYLAGIVIGGLILVIVGLIDDFRGINAVIKLGILFLTTLLLAWFGVRVDLFPDTWPWHLGIILDLGVTLLWMAGVASATNSLDNMDGAAGGTAAIACAAVFYIAWGQSVESSQAWLSYVAIALLGSSLGFLRYNYPGAKVFLGDNGSLLVGYVLAAMLVLGGWSQHPLKAIVIPCMILTVPLFDITLSTILRYKHGVVSTWVEAVVYCGRDHLSHRFMALGLSKPQALWALYAIGGTAAIMSVLLWRSQQAWQTIVLLVIYFAGLLALGWKLDQAPVYEKLLPGDTAPVEGSAGKLI